MHPFNTNSKTPCIKVCKVFDWIGKSAFIELQEEIQLDDMSFTEKICCDFTIPCSSEKRSTLWTSYGIEHIGGSICIEYKMGCGKPLDVYINHKKVTELAEGSSFLATYSFLERVEIKCRGTKEEGFCCGHFKINIHAESSSECRLHSNRDIKKILCYLSDCIGNPVSPGNPCAVKCEELTAPDERSTFEFYTRGKKVFLQRIDLLKQGFVTIELFNTKNISCKKCTIPFSAIETLFLCAPPSAIIDCEIVSADCKAYVLPSANKSSKVAKIAIKLIICQNVSSVGEEIIKLDAAKCSPREDMTEKLLCGIPLFSEENRCSIPSPLKTSEELS